MVGLDVEVLWFWSNRILWLWGSALRSLEEEQEEVADVMTKVGWNQPGMFIVKLEPWREEVDHIDSGP